MSSYYTKAKRPNSDKWEDVTMLDDYFGRHRYGVKFPDGGVYLDYNCKVQNPNELTAEDKKTQQIIDNLRDEEKGELIIKLAELANEDQRELVEKTETCFCKSYYDNGIVRDCTCGKCGLETYAINDMQWEEKFEELFPIKQKTMFYDKGMEIKLKQFIKEMRSDIKKDLLEVADNSELEDLRREVIKYFK